MGGITLTNDSTLPRNRRCKTEARFHCDPSFHRPHRFRSVGSAETRPGESEPRAISQRTQKICSSSRHLSRRCPNRNEETVPLLLERLRQDFWASEPSHPSGTGMALDCAQVHLIDALRAIINTDQGMFYRDVPHGGRRITADRSVNGCSTVFLWTAFTLSIPCTSNPRSN